MEAIIFDNATVRKCVIYPKCASTLQAVSHRDYSDRYSFDPRIECLDIDTFEKSIHGSSPDKTVDAVIGICTCTNDKRTTASRLLLVELRMNYKNPQNLSATEMNRKVIYTKELLGADIPVNADCYFIFDNNIIYQMKRWFANKAEEKADFKNNKAWSVEEFCQNVVSYDDLPYKAIYDKETIIQNLQGLIEKKNWNGLFSAVRFWLKQASGYKYSNSREYCNIAAIINEGWKIFKSQDSQLNEDEELDKMILEEDITVILS